MTDDIEPGGPQINLRELAVMLVRRRYWLVLPVVLGVLGALLMIVMQKPMYRSSATLLINSQQVPTTMVASPLTNFADERMGKIRQQIVREDNLKALVDAYQLYPAERTEMPLADVLNIMRGAIAVDLLGANATQAGGGTDGSTIAFTLSFTYADPAVAQAITGRLTGMFLAEDKRIRTEQTTGTASFIGRRTEELRRQLADLEATRRSIEARYAGALPDQVALSAQSEAALRTEVARIDTEANGLVQQNSLLAAREREIAATPPPGAEALRRAEERLNQLSAVYADEYPEVVAARATVAKQRDSVERERGTTAGAGVVQAQIAATRSNIGTLAGRRAELVSAISSLNRRAAQAPQASFELSTVQREYDNIKSQYEDMREKQLGAQVAANVQSEDQGERLSVVEEPTMPYQPNGVGAITLLLTGIAGGFAMGLVVVFAWEFSTGTIHGEMSLAGIMGAPPLGIVPLLRPDSRPTRLARTAALAHWVLRRTPARERAI